MAAGPALLVLGVLALLAPWRFPLSSDGLLIHRTAEALAFEGTFRLPHAGPGARLDPFYFREVEGGVVAIYPPLASALRAAILSASRVLPEGATRGRLADLALLSLPLLFTAAAVLPLTALCRFGGLGKRRARLLSAALILATFLGPLGSSDGNEPMLLFLVALALALALFAARASAARAPGLALRAGLAAGAALLAKPTAWILLPALAVALAGRRGTGRGVRLALPLALGVLPGLVTALALNAIRYGSPFEWGYSGPLAHPLAQPAPLPWSLLRLTVLPNRGLLVFAPLLLLSLVGIAALARRSARRRDLLASALAAAAFFGVNALWWAWEGGMGWGPRLAAPVVVLAAPLVASGTRRFPRMAAALAAIGALLNLSGYLVDPGRIYAEVAARPGGAPPLGPVVPIHRDRSGALYPVQRVHYVPACATWLVAPRLLSHLGSDAAAHHDAALVRALVGAPLLGPVPDSGRLLLQEGVVTAGAEPPLALRMTLRSLAFGAPAADAGALGSYLALRGRDPALAEALCLRGLLADPSRADLRANLDAARRARAPAAPR